MSRRKQLLQARQVSIFPVLLLVEADDQTGQTTVYPLPVMQQGRLALVWLLLLGLGWLQNGFGKLRRGLVQARHIVRVRFERTVERLSLELRMTLILSRQFGRVAVGR